MNIEEIYKLAIKKGMKADFRGEDEIKEKLEKTKEKYEDMSDKEKKKFDKEKLENPYSDTRVHYGDKEKEIKKVLVGIDIKGSELLLADKMGDIDLVISHHPLGSALAGLDDVMDLQIDVLKQYGVPVNIAEKLIEKRMSEVARGVSSANHNRVVDMARLLNIPLINVHTPCDNLVAKFVRDKIEDEDPKYIKDLMKTLHEIPEYEKATQTNAGPEIFVGSKESRTGKIVLTEITGGTEGSPEIYEKLAQAKAGTIVGMHMSEKHRKNAKKAHINVVIAGHISSDSIGVNLFLDQLEKKGIEIVPCGGLIRVSRN